MESKQIRKHERKSLVIPSNSQGNVTSRRIIYILLSSEFECQMSLKISVWLMLCSVHVYVDRPGTEKKKGL